MKEKNKKGISLIVLVITIIVMIIIAAAIILSLNSSGIISRAQGARDVQNESVEMEKISVALAEAELEGIAKTPEQMNNTLKEKLEKIYGKGNLEVETVDGKIAVTITGEDGVQRKYEINANGTIVAVKVGTSKLTKIEGTEVLGVGHTRTLTADDTVTWSSSDTSKATVDASGNVTGVAKGTVTITATSGDVSVDHVIEVKNIIQFNIYDDSDTDVGSKLYCVCEAFEGQTFRQWIEDAYFDAELRSIVTYSYNDEWGYNEIYCFGVLNDTVDADSVVRDLYFI